MKGYVCVIFPSFFLCFFLYSIEWLAHIWVCVSISKRIFSNDNKTTNARISSVRITAFTHQACQKLAVHVEESWWRSFLLNRILSKEHESLTWIAINFSVHAIFDGYFFLEWLISIYAQQLLSAQICKHIQKRHGRILLFFPIIPWNIVLWHSKWKY